MVNYPNILLIGGNARNSGKTSLACEIIRKFSFDMPIIGLKVTRMKPDEGSFHGAHSMQEDSSFFEETDIEGKKDTSRMLKAGAKRVFYLCVMEERLIEAMDKLNAIIPVGSLLVCESRSLRNYLEPGVFILMMRETSHGEGKDMTGFIKDADFVSGSGNSLAGIAEIVSHISLKDLAWRFE
ncbi:MAG: hypothetical protein HXX13_05950 [Bacteroidetes bacterium]|nr:hypothetical protein [Bacteroidota bacterium]